MMELVVCTFEGATKAEEAKQAIQHLDTQLVTVKLGNIAVLRKDEAGKFSFSETGAEAAVAQGTTIGMLSGMILGMLFGPAALAAGAAVGTLAGGLPFVGIDLGFPDPILKQLGDSLKAGSSALVTLLKPEERDLIIEELQTLGGTLIQHELPADIVQKLIVVGEKAKPS
ncbi:hypothetical protein DO97_12355 [Neosynechococcus sphagnicola sy1]|uniref:DUF1269 domain-containing protein n=1 Tax=Neosynechococcus sphagnicola sy1 TaxID=1497020 RepID=A0A098THQ3_9CYAN|nr:DUF1269 domain-containing protein [Neosynechococcus sphagnicola]KGF72080.1 hypothetical protein DO97_12355 [Neosynechococcus sphagnicola sy1]